jgi:hypothetical protein
VTTFARIAAFACCAVLVSGCGGGSSTPGAPRAASAAATAAPHTGTPLATETLTIKFPPTFHQARLGSSKPAPTSSKRRSPAYINPSPSPYTGWIDIFVDGTNISSAPPNIYTPDGTQTFSIPLYSTGAVQHTIVAVETEGGLNSDNNTILAIGETDVQTSSLAAGTSQAISLTMLENAQYIGVMSDPNDNNNDAEAFYGEPASSYGNVYYSAYAEATCAPGETFTVWAFAADATYGFAAANSNTAYGVGGIVPPTLNSWLSVSPADNDQINASDYDGNRSGYTITYNNVSDNGVLMNFTVTSPAEAIYNDIYQYAEYPGTGAYPGIEALVNVNGSPNVIPLQAFSALTSSPLNVQIDVQPYCSD